MEALRNELSIIGVEKPGALRTVREPEPGDNAQEYCKSTFDDEQVLPVVQMGVFDLEDTVGCRDCQCSVTPVVVSGNSLLTNRAGECARDCVLAVEQGNADPKIISAVEGRQVR